MKLGQSTHFKSPLNNKIVKTTIKNKELEGST